MTLLNPKGPPRRPSECLTPLNDEECGCCELHEYEAPEDDGAVEYEDLDVSCQTCGHTPEEHEDPQ